jgi:hypothetical protein
MPFDRQQLVETVASLAVQNVYVGTSSWKYTGWCGILSGYFPGGLQALGKNSEPILTND